MKLTVQGGAKIADKVTLLVIPCHEGKKSATVDPAWKNLYKKEIAAVLASGDFKGDAGSQTRVYPSGAKAPGRVVLVGLGKSADVESEGLRRFGGTVGALARKTEGTKAVVLVPSFPKKVDASGGVRAISEGVVMGGYRFDEYKTQNSKKKTIGAVALQLADTKGVAAARKAAKAGTDVGTGVNTCRDLGNLPPNVMHPPEMAARARKMARSAGLTAKILDEKALRREKMGALLAVAQGSEKEGRLIVLEYNPGGRTKKAPLVFVGKAVTFDTGGISIKPSAGMQDMKFDMCGGGAVIGAMEAIGRLKPKNRVIGIVAAAENMPAGNAYRPGDIITSASGITIEVINTDAEGRMCLADGLHYSKRYDPKLVVDLATLTGACVVALGETNSGIFTSDQKLAGTIRDAAQDVGEEMWPMPMNDEYKDLIRSDVADCKNSGGRWAGAITAAMFLQKFIEGHNWAHLDIAGTAWKSKESGYDVKGASGAAVRTLVRLAETY